MTPAEFRALAKARINDYERKRSDLDALNAKRCQIAAACVGVKDTMMKDFMIFRKEAPEKPKTAEQMNATLDHWVAVGGV